MSTLIAAHSSIAWNRRGVVTGVNMFARAIGCAVSAAILGAIAKGVIAAHGGDENSLATVRPASTAVFIGVVGIPVMLLLSVIAMRTAPVPASGPAATSTVAPQESTPAEDVSTSSVGTVGI